MTLSNHVLSGELRLVDDDIRAPQNSVYKLKDMETILVLCAGGLISGESALLLLSMTYPSTAPWSTTKNVTLALTDICLGPLLAGLALFGGSHALGWLFCGAAGVLLVTHSIREVEYLAGSGKRFAMNVGLFVFNNVRICLLAASLGAFFGLLS